jgi:hypothetical protein
VFKVWTTARDANAHASMRIPESTLPPMRSFSATFSEPSERSVRSARLAWLIAAPTRRLGTLGAVKPTLRVHSWNVVSCLMNVLCVQCGKILGPTHSFSPVGPVLHSRNRPCVRRYGLYCLHLQPAGILCQSRVSKY